ncbi:MAG TPA: DUF2752 domain-containing protein [Candidatus Limnocylindria bacterium]
MTDAAVLRRLAAAALVAAAVVPSGVVREGPVVCPFRAVTGRPCPSCGMTRSWSAMGHGRFVEASGHHLFGPITFLTAAALVVGGDQRTASLLDPSGRVRTALGLLGAAWAVSWVWRLATTPAEPRR